MQLNTKYLVKINEDTHYTLELTERSMNNDLFLIKNHNTNTEEWVDAPKLNYLGDNIIQEIGGKQLLKG